MFVYYRSTEVFRIKGFNSIQMKKRSIVTIQIILFFAVLCAILLAGLSPRGYTFHNNVAWLAKQPGIKFGKYGIAFSSPFISAEQAENFKSTGFSIEIALDRAVPEGGGVMFIALVHNGEDHSQLFLGQWRNQIIIMNGDDYNHKRKTPRLSMDTSTVSSTKLFVTVTTKDGWTKLYLNGKLMKTGKNVVLNIPAGERRKGRLIFGNSIYGRHTWRGVIHGFAIYGDVLSDAVINYHNTQWRSMQDFSFAIPDDPYLVYLFNEKSGPVVLDYSKHNNHLEIPTVSDLLERESFIFPFSHLDVNQVYVHDVAINLIGFLPFGFVLVSILYACGGIFRKNSMLIVVISGFILSFGIEFLQSWMPSRSSSLLDLLLNTTGSYLGALVFVFLQKKGKFVDLPDRY